MKQIGVALFLGVFCGNASLFAQADTAHHREVYAEVNSALPKMERVKGRYVDDPLEFTLAGWSQKGELRKIVATDNVDEGSEEYYLENEQPLFVYSVYFAGGVSRAQRIEERKYFKDERLFKWLTTERPQPERTQEDYRTEEDRIEQNTSNFVSALKKGKSGKAAAALRTSEGAFVSVEQGDYAHWNMRLKNGEEFSLFILRPDASVEKVIGDPKRYRGKRCRVKWKKSTQNIPEAGGKIEVEEIVSVEWIEK